MAENKHVLFQVVIITKGNCLSCEIKSSLDSWLRSESLTASHLQCSGFPRLSRPNGEAWPCQLCFKNMLSSQTTIQIQTLCAMSQIMFYDMGFAVSWIMIPLKDMVYVLIPGTHITLYGKKTVDVIMFRWGLKCNHAYSCKWETEEDLTQTEEESTLCSRGIIVVMWTQAKWCWQPQEFRRGKEEILC